MLSAVCHEIRNWFDTERQFGEFTIADGTMSIEHGQDNQYVRIAGSVFNDGVYQIPLSNLVDETFDGAVWLMAPPNDFLALVDEIELWQQSQGETFSGPYTSESFGGYSYSKKTAKDGSEYGWKDAFASRLNRWRKI